jgi:hypothetical protein
MKEFLGHALFGDGRKVEHLASLLESFKTPNVLLKRKNCDDLIHVFTRIGQGCEHLELPAAKASCDKIISLCSKTDDASLPKSSTIQSLFIELNNRIEVELKAHTFFCIPKEQSDFYKAPLKDWQTIIAAFPKTTYDIGEASKCLALRRNTACVFHLMRVMGARVIALGKSLNEPTLDASRNLTWDNVLRRCGKEVGERFEKMSPVWQMDKQFYAEATAKLFAVKDAWRNPNAHELGDKYTDEEAEDIYRTTRSFMRHLATKLKEESP